MSFKDKIADLKSAFDEAIEEAAGLHNQNLADILRAGVARIGQALEHPDIDRVGTDEAEQERISRDRDVAALNSGGNAVFAAGDPGAELQRAEASRRAAFPGSPEAAAQPGFIDPATGTTITDPAHTASSSPFPGTPAPVDPATGLLLDGTPTKPSLDPDAKHPGDPSFSNNADFTEPNAVDLNNDGTLKTAPNTKGVTDDRDGGKKE